MKYKIRHTEDIDEARELHKLLFPTDEIVPEEHDYWIATDESGAVAGFASVAYNPVLRAGFLSRCGVEPRHSQAGLQRRFIRARIKYLRSLGSRYIYTYTTAKNYPSIVNLLRCGFCFARPANKEAWRGYHLMILPLYSHIDVAAVTEEAAAQCDD